MTRNTSMGMAKLQAEVASLKAILKQVQELFERGLIETSENPDGLARSISDKIDSALADTADKPLKESPYSLNDLRRMMED